jgi:hypothetical protein
MVEGNSPMDISLLMIVTGGENIVGYLTLATTSGYLSMNVKTMGESDKYEPTMLGLVTEMGGSNVTFTTPKISTIKSSPIFIAWDIISRMISLTSGNIASMPYMRVSGSNVTLGEVRSEVGKSRMVGSGMTGFRLQSTMPLMPTEMNSDMDWNTGVYKNKELAGVGAPENVPVMFVFPGA